ncbi:BQ2448_7008 [Microbotryum intermedium]|uniref:BQ2448_7008 protein n=1 Tax=Microbotryum intermedium TaxID=269621 RepID=A0A238FM36_9BASI|nr:BQ2448_7008 [Microbotryum intermedium]
MNNNCNNNNASPTGIAPPRPPDPPGLSATPTKSYSAAVGVRSPAKPSNATVTTSAAVTSHPLMHDIANCVIVKFPPSTSVEQVLLALDKHYPSLAGAMPCVIKGQRALRFPKDANLDTLAANGLTAGKTLCQVEKLFAPSKNGVIQCTLTGFFSDAEGVRLFDEEIAAFGKVLARRTQYIGKTKHISGVCDFVLALKDADNLPPASLSIERDEVTERIPLRITCGMRHCVFCRSTSHVRKDCTVAPACKTCTKTTHATQRCPDRHVSSPQAPSGSRAPTAPAAAAAAAGPKPASATSASDRTTKKRRMEHTPAAQPEPSSHEPFTLSFNFTPQVAPQLAPNQGTASSLVEKSSESPSSETTSPSPSVPPPTPNTIMTRSKSIVAPAAADETPLAALQATEPTSKPSSPKPMPSAAPNARPDDADADDDAEEEAEDQGAPLKDTDSINEDRKRASLFSNLRSHNADWTQECRDLKLSALFTPFNNTAILWKSDSLVVTIDPESLEAPRAAVLQNR